MVNYLQAKKIAAKSGVPVEIIEKDFLIELILKFISSNNYLYPLLVFRGGTALKKIYFSEPTNDIVLDSYPEKFIPLDNLIEFNS